MSQRTELRLFGLIGLIALSSCNADRRLSIVSGTVAVDGQPVEAGTIHFQSNASSSSGGAAVTDGKFQMPSKDGFEPGEYTVVLQAFRKTGRTINDPQKGKVEETASLALSDSPQTVTLTHDNASSLALNFSAVRQ